VVGGLVFALLLGVNRLWAAADERGDAEAAHKRAAATTTTTVPPTTVPPTTAAGAPTVPPTPAPIKASVAASAQTGPAQNGCGQTTTYDAANVQDGDPATAWRTQGDGTGQSLQFTLPSPTHLTQVGLIPGYDKIDNCTSADRFAQMRRVTGVRWTFADGSTVDQKLTPDRTMQLNAVNVVTTTVTMEILGTTAPGELDFTPISEVRLVGYPA
jgi:hypothetical protein